MQGNTELIFKLNQLKNELHCRFPNDKEAYQKEKKWFYDTLN
jgi:hypothetical protein